jgi:transposase
MRPLTISDSTMVLALQDEIRRSEESCYDHRLHAVLLVAQNKSCRQAAALLGDSPRAVQYWVNQFEKKGFAGLQEKTRTGRPRRLKEVQLKKIDLALRKSPRDVALNGNIWDGKTLSAYIEREFDISIGVRQCQRMFRGLGFRLRKPRPMIAHADESKRQEFKKKSGKARKK